MTSSFPFFPPTHLFLLLMTYIVIIIIIKHVMFSSSSSSSYNLFIVFFTTALALIHIAIIVSHSLLPPNAPPRSSLKALHTKTHTHTHAEFLHVYNAPSPHLCTTPARYLVWSTRVYRFTSDARVSTATRLGLGMSSIDQNVCTVKDVMGLTEIRSGHGIFEKMFSIDHNVCTVIDVILLNEIRRGHWTFYCIYRER